MLDKRNQDAAQITSTQLVQRHSSFWHKSLRWQFIIPVLSLVLAIVGGWTLYTSAKPHNIAGKQELPPGLIAKITGFKPYYLKPGSAGDFILQPNSFSYSDGVLIYSMRNSVGKILTFTEEALPPQFDLSQLRTDKQFNTEYGAAVITDTNTRTTGALFTKDNTLIIINAPDPIGSDSMQQILESLSHVSR